MKKRNTILTVSLVALSLLSVSLFILSSDETKPVIDTSLFKMSDTEKMNAVSLLSARDTVDLIFGNSRWRVNGQWDADVQMIKVLFATLKQVEPRRPVATVMKDSISGLLKKSGTRVTISENGSARLQFIAGGNEDKTEAWFLKEGDDQPYVMTIPGYRVYAAGIFELGKSGWRNKRIFDFNWRNFKTLSVDYPRETKNNFEVGLQDKFFGIKNMIRSDTTKLNDFLDAISLLFADRFVPPQQESIRLKSLPVIARFEIRDIANKTYVLEVMKSEKQDREVYGRLTNGEMVAFSPNALVSIMKNRDYFQPVR